jgi:ABC-type dipeptide/oligopeptide/nickel transport system permease subunit
MPGVAIVAFALSVTVVGHHLQDRLEGRIDA